MLPLNKRTGLACLACVVIGCSGTPATAQQSADTPPPVEPQPPAVPPLIRLENADQQRLSGQYPEAVAEYESLFEFDDVTTAARIGAARCAFETGDYENALSILDDSKAEGPSIAKVDALRAQILVTIGRYEEAQTVLSSALDADPSNAHAHWLQCQLLEHHGRREESIAAYQWFEQVLTRKFPESAADATIVGRGFQRYCELKAVDRAEYVLQEVFQAAYGLIDRTYWPARLAAAELLRSKYKLEEAAEDYRAILEQNPHAVGAHIGLGYIALEGWQFDEVETHVAAAMQANPKSVEALNLQSALHIQERRYADALESARRALEINPHHLEALSLAAAAAMVSGDDTSAAKYRKAVADINTTCGLLHITLGDTLSGLRRFPEAEKEYLKAIEFDPKNPHPRTELGLAYMQWGREADARKMLESSWALDSYNERTHNTMELLDRLDEFVTHETKHFIIQFDEPDIILETYFADYLESIYEELCYDYNIELTDKTIIQVFPTHREFGVRITARPWIFTVGACTGRVIAMTSPRPDPYTMGPYHYANVLRHEFTHTVTLAATNNRIAHWFTEGLAVLQEDSPRSFAWCQLLARAIRHDRLFKLSNIDWGFIRPRQPDDRQQAYAQAEWMCEYLIERFGYDILNKMLAGFREGLTQAEVFDRVVGISELAFDADFATWARKHAETWGFELTPPDDPKPLREQAGQSPADMPLHARLARAELDAGNVPRAAELAEQVLQALPEDPTALAVYAEIQEAKYFATRDRSARMAIEDEALPRLQKLADVSQEDWTAPRLLGAIHLGRENWDQAERWYTELQRRCPMDPDSYRGLSAVYLQKGDDNAALIQLKELARRDDRDAEVPLQIGRLLQKSDQLAEARYWLMQSIYINPFDPAVHENMAAVLMQTNNLEGALTEYKVLCQLQPQNAIYLSNAALTCQRLGETDEAQDFARRAVAIDPNAPAAPLVGNGDD